MKRVLFSPCPGLLSVAVSPTVQAELRCHQPLLTRVDATARPLGAKDVASLRRYVTSPQATYGLEKDYVRFVGNEPKALPSPRK